VQLDEILRTFDEPTRVALRGWMQDGAVAFGGRGADLSIAIAALDPFSEEANRILTILDSQRLAVRELVRSGGEVFEALSERRGQLRGLVESTEAVFSVTAARDAELEEAFVVLPTFLEESRVTMERLERFAADADPLVRQLRPAARELGPAARAAGDLAPELERFFDGLRRATPAALDGLPALRTALGDDLPPLLGNVNPFLAQLTPILEGARRYRHEITAFLGNTAAATNAAGPSPTGTLNYLRTTSPLGPGSLAAYSRLLGQARNNPYPKPLGYESLGSGGLESFETRHCGGGLGVELTNEGEGGFSIDPELFDRLREFAFAGEAQSSLVPAPPCVQQEPFASIGGGSTEHTRYLHVRELP
jgi:ABC-type transporter Mla subunit MlaD